MQMCTIVHMCALTRETVVASKGPLAKILAPEVVVHYGPALRKMPDDSRLKWARGVVANLLRSPPESKYACIGPATLSFR